MATSSRSPKCFLERHGLVPTRRRPTPSFDFSRLLIHRIPLDQSQMDKSELVNANGCPPPDRQRLGPWPPPPEVRDDESG